MNRTAASVALAALLAVSLGCGNNEASILSATDSDEQIGTLPDDIQRALKALPNARVKRLHRDGIPAFVVGDLGSAQVDSDADAQGSLKVQLFNIAPVFRLDAQSLKFERFEGDVLGLRHARYSQTKNGLPVVGGDLIVHLNPAGTIYAVNGEARDGIALPTEASLTVEDARAAVQNELGHDVIVSGGRKVYVISTQDSAMHLAWEVLAEGQMGDLPMRDFVYVDAVTGSIVDRRPTIHSARNRKVYSANNKTSLPGTLKRSEGSAATSDSAVNAAYDNTGITYDFYKAYFNRDSYNNNGATLISSVHYAKNYSNAYWDGTQMVYGDGDGWEFSSLAGALDVTAHELTHAVTEHTANLAYQNEPGALNEAMSDILGSAAEAWHAGGVNANFFMVGEDCYTPGTPGDALRYLDDPVKDGMSYDYYPTRYTGSQDYGGVHLNSGIANLAYALLVKGGTHPRGKTNVQVPAIGFEKATRIFYRALTTYMTSSTNFAGARTATTQAAEDLYDAATAAAVDAAWTAVGVPGGSSGGGGGSNPPPSSGVTTLQNGVPVTVSGSTGSQNFYSISVPSGASNLTFKISGGTGDVDLYVRYGAKPTTSTWDYRPYLNGNNETVNVTNVQAGTWYVMLDGYAAYSGVTLVVSYTTGSGGGGGGGGGSNVLSNGVPVTLSGATNSQTTYTFTVPSGVSALQFKISGGTGDADLYVRYGAAPTTSTWDYRPYVNGNNETVNAQPVAGTWYVMVRGYKAYSNLSLVATYQ
ncbi:MAG: M4 family metallopeptidase [Myxococcaceae bacterium]|nr:M4 family metallopeptidase [Myxococcaceae bacterium]